MNTTCLVAAALSLLACVSGAAASDQVADAETGVMQYSDVALSPDGEYIAAIVRTPGQPEARNLVTTRLSDGHTTVLTGYSDIDVRWFAWANDTRLLFSTESRPAQPGEPVKYRGAFVIDRDGDRGAMIERARAARMDFLARLPGDHNAVLITRPGPGGLAAVYRLDLKTGSTRKLFANDHNVKRWLPDHAGRVRAAVGRAEGDGRERLLYRATGAQDWKEILQFDAGTFRPLEFHADNRRLIAASRIGRDRFVLLEFDPANPHAGKVLAADPQYDVFGDDHGKLTQARTGHLVSYRYLADKPRVVYFDRRWEGRQSAIDEALPGAVNYIVGFSDDERKLLVLSSSGGSGRGDYYLFDDIVRQLRFLVAQSG